MARETSWINYVRSRTQRDIDRNFQDHGTYVAEAIGLILRSYSNAAGDGDYDLLGLGAVMHVLGIEREHASMGEPISLRETMKCGIAVGEIYKTRRGLMDLVEYIGDLLMKGVPVTKRVG